MKRPEPTDEQKREYEERADDWRARRKAQREADESAEG